MDKKTEYKKIYKESFNDSNEFIDLFFNKVYDEEQAIMLDIDNIPVSALLLRQFKMNFHSSDLPLGYICAAATARKMRSHGYMSELILETMRRAYDIGDFMLALIPANRALYAYYDKFGFNTVFYIKEERYTSAHIFNNGEGAFDFSLAPTDDRVKKMFFILNNLREFSVKLGEDDYEIMVEDNRLDGGQIVSAYNVAADSVDAIAIAVVDDDRILVRDILAVTDIAREAVLGEVLKRFPGLPMTVVAIADDSRVAPLQAHGMGRIINSEMTLKAIAASTPKLKASIRVYDHQLPQNNHIYTIDNGTVTVNDGFGGKLDLDVTQEVLTSIIFSAPKMGTIFNLPTKRPFMSLMLE